VVQRLIVEIVLGLTLVPEESVVAHQGQHVQVVKIAEQFQMAAVQPLIADLVVVAKPAMARALRMFVVLRHVIIFHVPILMLYVRIMQTTLIVHLGVLVPAGQDMLDLKMPLIVSMLMHVAIFLVIWVKFAWIFKHLLQTMQVEDFVKVKQSRSLQWIFVLLHLYVVKLLKLQFPSKEPSQLLSEL
jgi:hypothetical protein